MATHSSILAWKIPWTEKPDGLQSMGVTKSWTQLHTHIHIYYVLRLASLRIIEILPRFLFQSLSEFIPHDRLKHKWHAYLPHVDHAYVRHF